MTDVLTNYVSEDLTPERSAEVDWHVATCADGANALAAYRRTLTLTTDAFDSIEAPAADIPERLVTAILAARRQH